MSQKVLDSIQLQRLVDGELPSGEQAALLRNLDGDPVQWRRVALALLEDQAFRREFAMVCSSESKSRTADVPVEVGDTSRPIGRSAWRMGWQQPWLLAASILLLVSGYFSGSYLRDWSRLPVNSGGLVGAALPKSGSEAGALRPDLAGEEEMGTLRLVSQEPNSPSVELPIYQVSELEPSQLIGTDPDTLMDIRRQLRRRGLDIDVQTELLEGELADGRKLVVPVRNVNLRSYGQ